MLKFPGDKMTVQILVINPDAAFPSNTSRPFLHKINKLLENRSFQKKDQKSHTLLRLSRVMIANSLTSAAAACYFFFNLLLEFISATETAHMVLCAAAF